MAVCNTQTLMANASCFTCLTDGWQRQLARLALLLQILQAKNPSYVLNIQQLLADGVCFECLTAGQKKLIKLQLLCELTGGIA